MFWYDDRFDISVVRGAGTNILRVDMNLVINSVTYRPLRFDNIGNVSIAATTASGDSSSGALVVAGGIGVGGGVNIGSGLGVQGGGANITGNTIIDNGFLFV
jgi:hypothetical protein